jgi:hypothetical protein
MGHLCDQLVFKLKFHGLPHLGLFIEYACDIYSSVPWILTSFHPHVKTAFIDFYVEFLDYLINHGVQVLLTYCVLCF